jgi:hypothetical protein
VGCDIRVDPLPYYEAGVARSLWSHHKGGRWEEPRLLCLSSKTKGVAEDQVSRTSGDFPRRNGGDIIKSSNFVFPIAALVGVSILVERIDSDAQGKLKRGWKGGDSCIVPFQPASFH